LSCVVHSFYGCSESHYNTETLHVAIKIIKHVNVRKPIHAIDKNIYEKYYN